ncbi:hypothetical protein ZYGR_0H02650 [Zygosaccharomyces rouxii]|uniref:histone acetyltransferase n=2 Tax=Zygosaccharomyces rouxii TaxID=4956 RepID=C5DRP4_ZYGRC|nr:uncharacterized protein ZYRO0B10120g [Zygosaccharomyces rouxii]KAH9200010.1 histone H3-K56 acetyltransferase [Zygosaccharomyces rouxii]GAV47423.1 hypothetical protein ZYGR_0H02650 [Zygosaccharomyces rouxii]CAR26455.1 ZYRO0B10120p [Zygosaccharomyces rouxii]
MNHNQSQVLARLLESCLPKDEEFQVLQLQSLPTQTHSIVTPVPKSESTPLTVKVQHFFSLFHQEKVIFALEIYVFLTLHNKDAPAERLIFVSKADTNGYCNTKISFKSLTKNLIKYILSIDPNYYLQKVKPRERKYDQEADLLTQRTEVIKSLRILSKRHLSSLDPPSIPNDFYLNLRFPPNYITKISLFTRPEPQYLFAESSRNKQKHCLDGSQLLQWWLSILDDILCQDFQVTAQARLQIPGEDSAQVNRHLKTVRFAGWQVGDIFGRHVGELAAFTVPLFPDDPKTRFLRQLVEEGRIHTTNLATFWTELAQRQEFRLSVIASVIGVQGTLLQASSHWPTSPLYQNQEEIYVADSKKQFAYIKSYITGEEYDTEEGALEAFANIRDFFKIRLNRPVFSILGAKEPNSTSTDPSQTQTSNLKRVNVITTLQTRKKPKK